MFRFLTFPFFTLSGLISYTIAAATVENQLFQPNEVHLLDGPFLKSIELNGEYLLKHDPDRLLAPFLKEAGLEPKAENYGNWEDSGLNGHSAGHFLSAFATMFAATGNPAFKDRLDYMVTELARCQKANGDGYVGGIPDGAAMWNEVAKGEIKVDRFSLNSRWVPWYNLHKTFAGLKDAWIIGGNEQAGEVLIELTRWCKKLTENLNQDQMQQMLYAEHGGMNDVLAELYQITNDKQYLALAERFSHHELLKPLAEKRDTLTGMHANTQIPKAIGFQRIANASGNDEYRRAAKFFWDNVAHERSVAFGGNSVREHFHAPTDFSSMLESREGPESCNTHNMMRLTSLLFLSEGESEQIDFYERALFNHILSVQNPDTGGFVYFTPIRPRHYRVYSQPEKAFWCCVGSGIENPGRYSELIYAKGEDRLFVNLFIPSRLEWKEQGLQLEQLTEFPESETTKLELTLSTPKQFTISIRRPDWIADQPEISINGETQLLEVAENGFIDISRVWKNGDSVSVRFPMKIRVEALPDNSDYYALLYGPILLASRTESSDLLGLFAGGGRMEHIAPGAYLPLDEAPTLIEDPTQTIEHITSVPDRPLHFKFNGEFRPNSKSSFELEPFYRIHESRYIAYWRVLSNGRYASVTKRLADEENARARRREITVDSVTPGEQQPEVEHSFKGAETHSGALLGKRYREASQWFEYVLETEGKDNLELALTYWGSEWGRACYIYANGQQIGKLECNANDPEHFVEKAFLIPSEILSELKNQNVTIRIAAIDTRHTPGIFDIAILDSTK